MAEHDEQVVDQIASFADQVLAAGVARLGGCPDHLGCFLDDLGADLRDAAREQLGGVRLVAWVRGPGGDRLVEFVEGSRHFGRRLSNRWQRGENARQ